MLPASAVSPFTVSVATEFTPSPETLPVESRPAGTEVSTMV